MINNPQSTDFQDVLTRYGAALGRVAASYEANPALQQELLQEVCLAVWQALGSFKGQSSLRTYVMRIAHNRAVTHVARQVRQPGQDSLDETTLTCGVCGEQQQHNQQQLAVLLRAIRQLPLPTRQVVTLSMEGFSYQEIAEIVGIEANHAGVILNRARKTLQEQVDV